MQLLRTSTFRLEEFFDQDLLPYAILSHTWGREEITLQELEKPESIALLAALKQRINSKKAIEGD